MRKNLLIGIGSKAGGLAMRAAGFALMMAALGGRAMAGDGRTSSVPEIDPGSMTSAMTLLVGGVMMLTGRLRRK
jgi:hypothetical protein